MIGDAVLREVIGADALAAVAGADERAALLGALLVLVLLLPFVEPGAQDTHRPVVVLVLTALVLALDFQLVGRALPVPDADGALGLVDVLSTGAAGAHLLPVDVLGADLDLDLVRLGQHGDRRCRRVDAALLLGLGNTLDAVPAALVAEVLVDLVAGDAEDDFLEAALLTGTERDVLDSPAHVAPIVRVHAIEIARKQGGLVAAGAGPNLQDEAVEILARINEEEVLEPALQSVAASAEAGQLLLREGAHLGIGFLDEQRLGLFDGLADRLVFEIRLHLSREGAVFPRDTGKASAVGDDRGVGELLFQLLVTAQGLLEDGPHERCLAGSVRNVEDDPTLASAFTKCMDA